MITKVLHWLLKLFGGESFSNPAFSNKALVKHFIIQKLFRINSQVPWPVHWTSKIKYPEKITRGTRNTGMVPNCYIDGRNGIIIGENVWIGPNVSIISMNHDTSNFNDYLDADPITIENNYWVGAGSIILPRVELSNHVVVAAGAVVTKSFRQNNILVGGVPAKVLKNNVLLWLTKCHFIW